MGDINLDNIHSIVSEKDKVFNFPIGTEIVIYLQNEKGLYFKEITIDNLKV